MDVRFRRGTKDFEGAVERQAIARKYSLSTKEFTSRARFRGRGNAYVFATPRATDPIYEMLLEDGYIEKLRDGKDSGLPVSVESGAYNRASVTTGDYFGSVMLYVRSDRKDAHNWRIPQIGERLEMADPTNNAYFTGRVVFSRFQARARTGHVVLEHFTNWGELAEPEKFTE